MVLLVFTFVADKSHNSFKRCGVVIYVEMEKEKVKQLGGISSITDTSCTFFIQSHTGTQRS
jgi:hypothetical protein